MGRPREHDDETREALRSAAERLFEEHGPEVLDACYGGGEISIPDALLHDAAIPCDKCGGSLAGRPPRGRCPGCGEMYDKPAFIRRFLGFPDAPR